METNLSTVLDIIHSVKDLDDQFQINHHQCKRLADFYSRAGQFFDQLKEHFSDCGDSSERFRSQFPSLDVTISVLQKGQLLIEKYTDREDWVTNIFSAGVNQDSFVAIHTELGHCVRLIHDAVVKKGRMPPMQIGSEMPLHFLNEDDRAILFRADAEKDEKHMLEFLEVSKGKILAKNAKMKQKSSEAQNLTMGEKSTEALDMASEKIRSTKTLDMASTSDQQPDQLPGYLRINPSEIMFGDQIGLGGSAEVFKCRWLQCDCAVKIFRAGDVDGLRKELENLIPLRHPNVVLLMGFSVGKNPKYSADGPMVVMELLDSDLYTLIHKDGTKVLQKQKRLDPLPISMAINFIYQIASGMEYIHKKGLLHGDLKALNVLVKRTHLKGYELKISDFGVSEKILSNDQISGHQSDYPAFSTANAGTAQWRAPEVFKFPGAYSHLVKPYTMKADVYSFAMTCVEILTRQVPFHDVDSTEKIRNLVLAGRRPKLPSFVPEDLRQLIERCWVHEPKRRPGFSEICSCMQNLKDPPPQARLSRTRSRLSFLSCYPGQTVAD